MPTADRLIELFHRARAHAAGHERDQFLAEVCRDAPDLRQQLLSLLEADQQVERAEFLRGRPVIPPAELLTEKPGDQIGDYRLLEKIGEGGCGVVYMAEQERPVRRRVAFKAIKLGMDTKEVVARFEAERQALALMEHPNIAKVFDAGVTHTSRPYFVMELVRGLKITSYCDDHQLATEERLDLFVQVCSAVHHAHQKGIIHRDLKPSNILVAQHDTVAVPKVIDFGIAKVITGRLTDKTLFTAFEQFIGTPAYMSPEQAQLSGLDIDTRTDIYSLGVLLYELLTGNTPFDVEKLSSSGLDEIRRVIREKEPAPPSTRLSALGRGDLGTVAARRGSNPPALINRVHGDLDWIVMKCLEKERGRRYETAYDLALDVERTLRDEPVLARPPSNWYRLQKFARRNKALVASAIAIAGAGLFTMGALAVSTVLISREQQTTKRALETESRTKDELAQALGREQRTSYFHRIALAHHELLENNLLNAQRLLEECPPGYRAWEWNYLRRLRHLDPVTLRNQPGRMHTAAFSPDGLRLASAGDNETATLWDVETGRALLTLPDTGEVSCAVFRPPAGQWLVTGNRTGDVTIWDLTTRQTVRTLRGHTGTIRSVAFAPDGQRLASGADDQRVKIWDVATGALVHELTSHSHLVSAVAFSPDGKLLASGSWDATVRLWDATTAKAVHTLRGSGPVTGLAFGPDGRRLASSSFDMTVKIWDVSTGQRTLTLAGHVLQVHGVAFLDGGRRVASASEDNTLKIWDAATGQLVLTLRGHSGALVGLISSPDGQRLASTSADRTTRIWDATPVRSTIPTQEVATLRGHNGVVFDVAFSPSGKHLASASGDGTVRIWDSQSGREEFVFREHRGTLFGLAFSHDGRRVASGGVQIAPHGPSYLKVWDPMTGQEPLRFSGNAAGAYAVALSPEPGQWLVTGDHLGDVTVWDATTGQPIHTLGGRGPSAWGLAFSPDGRRLACLSIEGMVTVYDVTRWPEPRPPESVVRFRAHQTWVRGRLAFSPDGRRLIVPGDENTANIWDVTNSNESSVAAPPMALRGHVAQVWTGAFSPDGRLVATGGEDKTVKLWDAKTGELLRNFRGHSYAVTRVVFSPDGTHLASASLDKTVRVWDTTASREASRE